METKRRTCLQGKIDFGLAPVWSCWVWAARAGPATVAEAEDGLGLGQVLFWTLSEIEKRRVRSPLSSPQAWGVVLL